ncbi:AGAP005617-PA-like protein [Anopheles sinensis]|uniref:AGAP005617-PA-like protein n=1 Tax=Anopheles sinensis TaxID=74873 RepID=A0A084VCA2_ANOSI|nr:AGAP005617-PA-like protein [Anopheles sinensis]
MEEDLGKHPRLSTSIDYVLSDYEMDCDITSASEHVDGSKGLIHKLANACHIRQWKNKCGMRRPSLGQNEDDLSRLTTIISPTSISLSSNGQSDPVVVVVDPIGKETDRSNNGDLQPARVDAGTGSGGGGDADEALPPPPPPPSVLVNQYLPNLINSSEWQNCRKRKERQDSTSSISQDRKLIRSNSEEHLPNCQEVIRRVSSHEDFKKRTGAVAAGTHGLSVEISIDKENIIAEESIDEVGAEELADQHQQQQVFEKNLKNSADDLKKFFIGSVENVANGGGGGGALTTGKDSQYQHNIVHQLGGHHHHLNHHHLHHGGGKSQQHHRLSPCRDILKSRRDSDSEQDGEHERRRHCERFSKTRPPPGRKSVSPRARSTKHSKFAAATVKAAASVGGSVVLAAGNEHFYSKHDNHSTGGSKSERRRSAMQQLKSSDDAPMFDPRSGSGLPPLSDYNDNNVLEKDQAAAAEVANQSEPQPSEEPLSPREKLPWGQSYPDDTPALVCQRFSDDKFDHAKRMDSVSHAKLRPIPSGGSLKLYGAHHRNAENAPPGHHGHHGKPAAGSSAASNMFDERVKAINRKLSGLKKKLTQYEERFERDHGCRPTHGDKSADPAIKSVVVEVHKLRKEKTQIKADLAVFSAKAAARNSSGLVTANQQHAGDGGNGEGEGEVDKRLGKMKETIADIEKRLMDKRESEHRSENLELLTNEQLTEEKASVQRALLYLESMYGRPASREERDAARPLYDRYRLIKRLVNRANSISGPCGVASSLMPTILEHEALAIVAGTTTPSTDISPPSATSMIQSPTDTLGVAGQQSTDEASDATTTTTTSNSATENIHSMTPDELWQHYDATREEKKELRRTIKDFEQQFEETTGRKMLKSDRKSIEETYALYKQKKAKLRLIDALFKKQMQV